MKKRPSKIDKGQVRHISNSSQSFIYRQKDLRDLKWKEQDRTKLSDLSYRIPRIETLVTFNVKLSACSFDDSIKSTKYLETFIKENGVQCLLKAILNRLPEPQKPSPRRVPFKTYDLAILFESLQCVKAIINVSIGMDSFLSCSGSVLTLCQCLNFQCKLVSLLVLDLLTFLSCHSAKSAISVYRGLQVWLLIAFCM